MNSESASNIAVWKQLHKGDYFRNHPCYDGGTKDTGWIDVEKFEELIGHRLDPKGWMAVIGCGYGRESKHFVKRVERVYGIDVAIETLQQAVKFVWSSHFIPVLAEDYKRIVPPVDYVYSHAVFQHIPHELAIDYIETFKGKLKPGGAMVVQFTEHSSANKPEAKPEPVYSWNRRQLQQLFGERTLIQTVKTKPMQRTHYVCWFHDHSA